MNTLRRILILMIFMVNSATHAQFENPIMLECQDNYCQDFIERAMSQKCQYTVCHKMVIEHKPECESCLVGIELNAFDNIFGKNIYVCNPLKNNDVQACAYYCRFYFYNKHLCSDEKIYDPDTNSDVTVGTCKCFNRNQ